ncbi:hypothetical protein HK104_003832 [Borealophlyctis nickersoniae]|nr:hypothetical protein HK104_003832 [Borealophlyctis nickersoniae]
MLGLFAYFIWILLYLATPESPVVLAALNKVYTNPNVSYYMILYHLAGFFWTWAFLIGIAQVTIAGAFATYYWTMDKRHVPSFPVVRSLGRTVRYHLGSIAIGSLLIAIVMVVRVLVWWAQRQAAATGGNKNKFAKYVFGCIQCLLAALTKLIKFINKNAYIEIAVRGRGFFSSASAAFGLILRNGLRLLAVNLVGNFILFLSTCFITIATALIGYFALMKQQDAGKMNDVTFPFVVAAAVGLEAFVVAQVFLGVYEMGIDTIFLCFLEDDERNDGSPDKPYYMSDGLKHIVNKKNKQPAQVHPVARSAQVHEY